MWRIIPRLRRRRRAAERPEPGAEGCLLSGVHQEERPSHLPPSRPPEFSGKKPLSFFLSLFLTFSSFLLVVFLLRLESLTRRRGAAESSDRRPVEPVPGVGGWTVRALPPRKEGRQTITALTRQAGPVYNRLHASGAALTADASRFTRIFRQIGTKYEI